MEKPESITNEELAGLIAALPIDSAPLRIFRAAYEKRKALDTLEARDDGERSIAFGLERALARGLDAAEGKPDETDVDEQFRLVLVAATWLVSEFHRRSFCSALKLRPGVEPAQMIERCFRNYGLTAHLGLGPDPW